MQFFYQEELKINRIKLNLMVQNVLDYHEQELLQRKKDKIDAQVKKKFTFLSANVDGKYNPSLEKKHGQITQMSLLLLL